MSNQAAVIAGLLRGAFKGRRARVGVAFLGHGEVLEQLLLEPHYFVVFGDRFHPMFRTMTRAAALNELSEKALFLECRFDAPPVSSGSLDAVILLGGLPRCAATPLAGLEAMRELLIPGGLLVWPQPLSEGFFGRAARIRHRTAGGKLGAVRRARLTRLTMEAGFRDVGQSPVIKSTLPWTVTHGRAVSRPRQIG